MKNGIVTTKIVIAGAGHVAVLHPPIFQRKTYTFKDGKN
jgi:hypothetical protein